MLGALEDQIWISSRSRVLEAQIWAGRIGDYGAGD